MMSENLMKRGLSYSNFGSKKVVQIMTVESLVEKNFGKLKSSYIGNVMEIVKIGKKTWQIAVICQMHQSFLTTNVLTV